MKSQRWARTVLLMSSLAAVGSNAVAQSPPSPGSGTVVLNDLPVPISNLLSPEAQAYVRHLIVDQPFAAGADLKDIQAQRAFQDGLLQGWLAPMRARYAVTVEPKTIAGLYADLVLPKEGVSERNKHTILLNLHGGGFITGARTAGLVESVPIAATERITVLTLDYRMWPEHQFPAASEDVAAVYRELLKQYSPGEIGIYGCSAGGMLTGMSIAWFHAHALPMPAAVGVLCAGLKQMFVGDAAVLAGPLNGLHRSEPANAAATTAKSAVPTRNESGYLRNADPADPLAYPGVSPELLKSFPPTLLVTSTRGFEFGSALDASNALTRAGVEEHLHVWDGLPHAFWYNSELPESREVYAAIAKFFDQHLAR